MCGLVGMVGCIDDALKKVFNDLLVLDVIRGHHSTGVMTVGRYNKEADIHKKAGTPDNLFDSKAYAESMKGAKFVLMGHNRWATKGAINASNAHPFEHGNIIGCHNGTLRNQDLLDDSKMFAVDSENIFYHMNKNGVEDTISKLHGAYALTWWDKADQTINFCRNAERPLVAAYTKDRRTLIWASESWMITVACGRHKVEHTDIFNIDIDKHYKVKLPEVKAGIVQPFALEDFIAVPVVPFRLPVTTTNYSAYGYGRGTSTSGTAASSTAMTQSPSNTGKYNGHGQAKNAQSADFSDYSDYIGEMIEFVVRGTEVDGTSKEIFIDAELIDDEAVNIRLFPPADSMIWQELLNSTEAWRGLAKKFSPRDGGYLVMDLRTLTEVPGLIDDLNAEAFSSDEDDSAGKEMVKGFNGRLITTERYSYLLGNGCSWCGSFIMASEWADIKWVSDTDWLCPHCKDDAQTAMYFRHIGD